MRMVVHDIFKGLFFQKLGQFGTFSGKKSKLKNFPVVIGKHFLNWLHAPTYSKNTKTN